MTVVSPSPRELFERLTDDEKVAIDLILQALDEAGLIPVREREAYLQKLLRADTRLKALVPDSARQGYLQTLAMQLKALGFSLHESRPFDASVEGWQEAARRYQEQIARAREIRTADEQRDRDYLASLPPNARRALLRRRRKQGRRA